MLARVRERSRRATTDAATLTLLRGLGLWVLACILAWVSIELTRRATLAEYREHYSPPLAAWEALLTVRGYRPEPAIEEPLAPGKFRVTRDLERVLLPGKTELDPRRVWRIPGRPESPWQERAFHLRSFEEWIETPDSRPRNAAPGPKSIDPREIRY